MGCRRVPLLLATAALAPRADAAMPNFMIYQPDDFENKWQEAPALPPGIDAQELFPTPHLDRLRTEGVVFTRAYCSAPMCSPSRFSVMTGRFQSRSHYAIEMTKECDQDTSITDVNVNNGKGLTDSAYDKANNLATALRAVDPNYYMGAFGKWHLSSTELDIADPEQYPIGQALAMDAGFDVAAGFFYDNMNGKVLDYSHNMEWMVAEVLVFLQDSVDNGRPFFAFVNPTPPHEPTTKAAWNKYTVRDTPIGVLDEDPNAGTMSTRDELETLCEAFSDDCFAAVWVDDAFGALYNSLLQLGVLDETLIVFAMDHGQLGKGSLFESAGRIAMFARYPPLFQQGAEVSAPVSNVDILPTFVDIAAEAAGTSPPEFVVDGLSFKGIASGEGGGEDRTVIYEIGKHRAAVTQTHKLLRLSTEGCGCKGGRTTPCEHDAPDEYPYRDDTVQLYDLTADPAELVNIAEMHGSISVLSALNKVLDDHMESTQFGTTPAPTAAPTPAPTMAPITALWAQHATDTWCERYSQLAEENKYTAATVGDCQAQAVENGHSYFQYRDNRGCATMDSCDTPRSANGWTVYHGEAPTPASTPAPTPAPTTESYQLYLEGKRCLDSATFELGGFSEEGCAAQCSSLPTCAFISFRSSGTCWLTTTCDRPRSTFTWTVFTPAKRL